jgi:hypothetical protein
MADNAQFWHSLLDLSSYVSVSLGCWLKHFVNTPLRPTTDNLQTKNRRLIPAIRSLRLARLHRSRPHQVMHCFQDLHRSAICA